jgi:hypothetical protein
VASECATYELQTPAGRDAAARRAANAAARDLDLAIEAKLAELRALMTLRRVALALPAELLSRGWVPMLTGPDDPIQWRPPPP